MADGALLSPEACAEIAARIAEQPCDLDFCDDCRDFTALLSTVSALRAALDQARQELEICRDCSYCNEERALSGGPPSTGAVK